MGSKTSRPLSNSSSEIFNRFNWFIIIKKCNIESIEIFIKNKFNVNTVDNEGKTALMKTYSTEIIKLLLEAGANVNIQDINGETAIMKTNSIDIIKLLIDSGANVNIQDKKGRTILMNRHTIDIVKLLIDSGANINTADKDGKTVLYWAIYDKDKNGDRYGYREIQYQNRYDRRYEDRYQNIQDIRSDVVKLLLESGASTNFKYKNSNNFFKCNKFDTNVIQSHITKYISERNASVITRIKEHDLEMEYAPDSDTVKELGKKFNKMKDEDDN